jgi:hypothetical protein
VKGAVSINLMEWVGAMVFYFIEIIDTSVLKKSTIGYPF